MPYKPILAWAAGIAATLAVGAGGILLLSWIGVPPGGSKVSSVGVLVAAVAIGIRSGGRVSLALRHPNTDEYHFKALASEKALLRAITAGALVFVILTVPLDLLSLPGTTWLAAMIYTGWTCTALAAAVVYGNFIHFHNMRKGQRSD